MFDIFRSESFLKVTVLHLQVQLQDFSLVQTESLLSRKVYMLSKNHAYLGIMFFF